MQNTNVAYQNVTGFGKTLRMGSARDSRKSCAFLVAQVQICQSPDFVIYMSNNPSNCCRLLRRLVVLYEGETSLHFDPPSRHSHRTRNPLLWAVIRILYLDTARFIDPTVRSLTFLASWASKNNRLSSTRFGNLFHWRYCKLGETYAVHSVEYGLR